MAPPRKVWITPTSWSSMARAASMPSAASLKSPVWVTTSSASGMTDLSPASSERWALVEKASSGPPMKPALAPPVRSRSWAMATPVTQ